MLVVTINVVVDIFQREDGIQTHPCARLNTILVHQTNLMTQFF